MYGLVRGGNNPDGTSSHKFVGSLGHPSEDNTGLIYMRARYYDPAVGRFASEDTAYDGSNWFSYCSSSPISYCDPSGNFTLITLFLAEEQITALEQAEAKMALTAYSFAQNKIFCALCVWADKFAVELWGETVDRLEWTSNNNLRIPGVDGLWEIRFDFSGQTISHPTSTILRTLGEYQTIEEIIEKYNKHSELQPYA